MEVTATQWFLQFLRAADDPPPAPRLGGRASTVGEWMDVFLAAAEGRPQGPAGRQHSRTEAPDQHSVTAGPDARDQTTDAPESATRPPPRYRDVGGSDT